MERIYLDISYLYFLFILSIMANCSTSKELFFFFFSPVLLMTKLLGTAAGRKIFEAESAYTDSDKSQLRANFQRIIIDVTKAEFMMVRLSEILFINALIML